MLGQCTGMNAVVRVASQYAARVVPASYTGRISGAVEGFKRRLSAASTAAYAPQGSESGTSETQPSLFCTDHERAGDCTLHGRASDAVHGAFGVSRASSARQGSSDEIDGNSVDDHEVGADSLHFQACS